MELPRQLQAAPIESLEARLAQAEEELAEAKETLRAIQSGEVDALVVAGPEGEQVFTLQGAETPYRFLVEEMNEGALLLAPDGTVLFANARFASLACRPLEGVTGSPWEAFFPSTERLRLGPLLARARQGGAREEIGLLGAGAAVRPVQLSVSSMKRERVEGFGVIVTDLTERKAAELALEQANAKLRDMVRELEHFSYTITHDMRAPLRALRGFAVLLENENSAGAAYQESFLRRIRVAAERMDALIQDALSYAKALREELPLEPVQLGALLRELVDTYPNLHPDQADIDISGEFPPVLGNRAALTQCFANLLNNAAKFVLPGLKPRVRVWAEPLRHAQSGVRNLEEMRNEEAGERPPSPETAQSAIHNPPSAMVRVWLEDNGIGIPKRLQTRIFDMFERGTTDYEGTGIGLAIVRKVVQQMQGSVGVESEPGQGSRFWVELKAAA